MSHKLKFQFQVKTVVASLAMSLRGLRRPAGGCISTSYLTALLLLLMALACPVGLVAQSTQGLILGTVRDTSGAVVPGAEVRIVSIYEGSTRTVTTDALGNYRAADLKPDRYKLEVSKSGFVHQVVPEVSLLARQELRQDFTLQVGAVTQEVTVTGAVTAITTENSAISASLGPQDVLDLPANFRASSSGTSPLLLVQTLPGVQPDAGNSFSVQGGLPSQSETAIDGISTQDTTFNLPLSDAFPSAESIAELRVDGVGNNAEYGQPGEVTSISKAGTNNLHGGVFWYHQNRAFDATAFGSGGIKPQKIGNDFGFTLGGPVFIPHLYHGRNKTFFFATYEGFRFPQGESVQEIVPTTLMRTGDFSKEMAAGTLTNPFTGGTYANNTIPSIVPAALELLNLFPSPNVGDPTVLPSNGSNYITNKDNSYQSSQFDIRGDQNLGTKTQIFTRYTWKNISQKSPNVLLVPSSDFIDRYRVLVVSFNYALKPALLNEFRFGFTLNKSGSTNSFDGPGLAHKLNLTGIGPGFPFNGIPELDFNNNPLKNLDADRLTSVTQSRTFQFNDNLDWTRGRHSLKFGFDLRKIEAITPLGFFGADNYGTFAFDTQFTGNSFADFLLGLPSQTSSDTVSHDNDGQTKHYHLFAQDTWQATPRLTLTYGVRWEFHPAYHDPAGNIGNFDPSVPLSGRVIYPDGKQGLLSPGFLANFNACPGPTINGAPCTPVLSNSEAGLPSGLRTATKRRFMPRFGFAYRPFKNDKTAIRGGFGVYNITLLGRNFYSLTGTLQSNTQTFNNLETPTGPAYQWPAINAGGSGFGPPQYGSAYFGTANDIHWKDPYSLQWNLSLDHELPGGIGARVSYIGMKTDQLVWAPNLNDLTKPSTTSALARPLSDFPFPNWGTIQDRANGATALYHSFQLEVRRNFHNGLTFTSSYTWARNVADNQGPDISGFAGENGGARATYLYDRHLDYGNVSGTRRQRWLTTAIYELPIGRGKLLGSNMSKLADTIVGGWQLSNIFVWQTGPFLTPNFSGGDPSGTGSGVLFSRDQHPDRVGSGVPQHQDRNNWIDKSAFICPGLPGWTPGNPCDIGGDPSSTVAPIGRFGNSGVGVIVGPGTVNLSTGLSKAFTLTERVRLKVSASFTNVLNHTNLGDPNLDITSGSFGSISSARGSDFGGSRTGQVSLRIDF